MWNIDELGVEAETLMDSISKFTFEAGIIESRLALNLWSLQRSMQSILDQVYELLYEQE